MPLFARAGTSMQGVQRIWFGEARRGEKLLVNEASF